MKLRELVRERDAELSLCQGKIKELDSRSSRVITSMLQALCNTDKMSEIENVLREETEENQILHQVIQDRDSHIAELEQHLQQIQTEQHRQVEHLLETNGTDVVNSMHWRLTVVQE
jgi:hypothetical protein